MLYRQKYKNSNDMKTSEIQKQNLAELWMLDCGVEVNATLHSEYLVISQADSFPTE